MAFVRGDGTSTAARGLGSPSSSGGGRVPGRSGLPGRRSASSGRGASGVRGDHGGLRPQKRAQDLWDVTCWCGWLSLGHEYRAVAEDVARLHRSTVRSAAPRPKAPNRGTTTPGQPKAGNRCRYRLLLVECPLCRPGKSGVVYVTGGGSRFHRVRDCPALRKGQQSVLNRGGTPDLIQTAGPRSPALDWRNPCRTCFSSQATAGPRRTRSSQSMRPTQLPTRRLVVSTTRTTPPTGSFKTRGTRAVSPAGPKVPNGAKPSTKRATKAQRDTEEARSLGVTVEQLLTGRRAVAAGNVKLNREARRLEITVKELRRRRPSPPLW